MRIRERALLLYMLPALGLLGLPAAAAAAPSPTPSLAPGHYAGTLNMTIMHSGSVDSGGISTEWSIDMVGSIGTIDIVIMRLGTVVVGVDMPVPIDYHNSISISDEASKCKGAIVAGSGYGRATVSGYSRGGQTPTGGFTVERMDFALSSMSARIKKNGECPSDTWGPEARTAIISDFGFIFGSQWSFTITTATPASLAGTCESVDFGKAKGQTLSCGWRVFRIPSE